MDMMDRTLN